MSVWDQYEEKMSVRGATRREAAMRREKRRFSTKAPDSLAYHPVFIYDAEHGYNVAGIRPEDKSAFAENVMIIDSDNLDEKRIVTLPGKDIDAGCLVEWMGSFWLTVEKDANTTLYTRAKLKQCNYLLRWVTPEPQVYEQWCIVEDGTKLREIVSAQSNLRAKISIELLETPKAYVATA